MQLFMYHSQNQNYIYYHQSDINQFYYSISYSNPQLVCFLLLIYIFIHSKIYNIFFSMASKSISQNRILQEMKGMLKDKAPHLFAHPLENDLFIWHFTILGPSNTDFHEGIYHGQIVLPFQYPFRPPDIYFFNKNGRFEVNTKICLTITQYHPQQWNTAWTIRTMLEAVISLFNEHVPGVGYIESNSETRRYLAKQSQNYVCQKCGPIKNILTVRKKRQQKQVIAPKQVIAAKQQIEKDIPKQIIKKEQIQQVIEQKQQMNQNNEQITEIKPIIQNVQIENIFHNKEIQKIPIPKRTESFKEQKIIQKIEEVNMPPKKKSVFSNYKNNVMKLHYAVSTSKLVKNN